VISVVIHPDQVWDQKGMLSQFPGLKQSTLSREISLGRLKVRRRGRVSFFVGADVLEWIRGGEVKPDEVDISEE